jgi:hypothetical protein
MPRTVFVRGSAMARSPVIWYYLYGLIIPVAVIAVVLVTSWGGVLIVMGALVWMGFALTMFNPKAE